MHSEPLIQEDDEIGTPLDHRFTSMNMEDSPIEMINAIENKPHINPDEFKRC